MATCLHATCQQEAEYCRKFGYKGPIAIVPNAVVISKDATLKKAIYRDERGRRQIGFLGRLHPIKMVEQVLYALAKIKDEGIGINEALSFQIMGQFDKKYEQWLRDEVKRLGLLDCVTFVGTVSGREKYERLSNLSALMVPSIQENFGMIVPEALICGTPVYASFGTPWNELIDYDAGWWRNNEPETIACVIKEIMSLNDDQLLRKGRNGRELIEKKYDQHKVARMMMELYEWCIFNGERPAFVMVD
jgi:glycosyltransferase involved in cell wall biosynthesis